MRSVAEIASNLSIMAELMEIKGENEFKVRAFKVAAEILASYRFDTSRLLQDIESPGIPKIGTNLAAKIKEFAVAKECQDFKSLLEAIPLSVLDLKMIPGLGAKKVKTLWQDLSIKTIFELETACKQNKLLELKGFGEKQQAKTLKGIEQLKKYIGLMKQPRAYYLAQLLSGICSVVFQSAQISIVGELARKLEVISSVELLICDPEIKKFPEDFIQLLENNLEFASVEKQQAQISILTNKSEKILLHLTDPEHLIRRQLVLTGDSAFVSWAIDRLDFSVTDNDEQQCFERNNIIYVAPELREVESEKSWGKLKESDLIQLEQIQAIIHCHSTYSDGIDTLKDMAFAARDAGYCYLGIADHSISARYAGGLSLEKIDLQHQEIELLNKELAPFRVLKGIESDITTDGSLDYPDKILEKFDFIVASVHNGFQMSTEEMTARVIKALKNPYTSILGHPTGRLLLEREAYNIDLEQVIKVAIENSVVIEINASPYRLDLDWRWARIAKDLGAKFSINPDSHRITSYSDLKYGVNVARKAGLTADDVINSRSAEEFLSALGKISKVKLRRK